MTTILPASQTPPCVDSEAMPELQLDGLPGPTLIHGGLAPGNLASLAHAQCRSQPRAGARACLAKMRAVMDLGVTQAFLPPLLRPDKGFLQACGYTAQTAPPYLLHAAGSTAYQWTANVGTCAAATDTADGRARIVVANLAVMLHRSREAPLRAQQLRELLPLQVVDALPPHASLGDEGAANHSRVVGPAGVCHVFVYGHDGDATLTASTRLPTRQSLTASQAVARLLQLPPERCLFVRQSPLAIDAGAFHNDVVMVGAEDHLLLHEHAWVDQSTVLAELQRRCGRLHIREVTSTELSLTEAVASYLFNAQLLDTPGGWTLVAPEECASGPAATLIARLRDEGFISQVRLIQVRESMRGGGGPACLRLRVPLTDAELVRVHPGIRLTPARITALEQWVDKHYREELVPAELADPQLFAEAHQAASALARMLQIPEMTP
jgi:succinylarginine dihydrolase